MCVCPHIDKRCSKVNKVGGAAEIVCVCVHEGTHVETSLVWELCLEEISEE